MMNYEPNGQLQAQGGGYGPPGGAPPGGGYGGPPPGGYGGPPPGAPPGGFGGPPPGAPPGGFGGPPPGAPPGGFGGPPPGAPPGGGGYGGPPPGSPPGGFGPPPGGFGAQPPPGAPMGAPPAGPAKGKNSTLAIVSLVTGILAIIPCCNFYIMPFVAIITGFLAKKEIKQKPELGGNGMATGGIALGIASFVIMIVITILQVALGAFDQIMRAM